MGDAGGTGFPEPEKRLFDDEDCPLTGGDFNGFPVEDEKDVVMQIQDDGEPETPLEAKRA